MIVFMPSAFLKTFIFARPHALIQYICLHVLSKLFSKSSVFIDEGIRFPSYTFSNENGLMWTAVHWKGVRIIRKALICPFRKAYAAENCLHHAWFDSSCYIPPPPRGFMYSLFLNCQFPTPGQIKNSQFPSHGQYCTRTRYQNFTNVDI
jgi:hypothetical protein